VSTSGLALLVVAISALMLPVTWRALRTATIVHRDWDSTSTLVFFAGLAGNLPTALSQLVSPSQPTYNAFGVLEVGLTGWALRLEQLTTVALLAGSVLFFSLRFVRHRYLLAPFIALAVAFTGDLSDLIHAQAGAFGPRELTLLALLLAAVVARPGRSAYLGQQPWESCSPCWADCRPCCILLTSSAPAVRTSVVRAGRSTWAPSRMRTSSGCCWP
jgi:hypothetical protein